MPRSLHLLSSNLCFSLLSLSKALLAASGQGEEEKSNREKWELFACGGTSVHIVILCPLGRSSLDYQLTIFGRLVRASRTKNEDLFYALPWSHGSLGLLVGLTLRIIPVKPYVRVEYHTCFSQAKYCEMTRRFAYGVSRIACHSLSFLFVISSTGSYLYEG